MSRAGVRWEREAAMPCSGWRFACVVAVAAADGRFVDPQCFRDAADAEAVRERLDNELVAAAFGVLDLALGVGDFGVPELSFAGDVAGQSGHRSSSRCVAYANRPYSVRQLQRESRPRFRARLLEFVWRGAGRREYLPELRGRRAGVGREASYSDG